ncbi:MAG TPA: bifunctional DNA primase/polymerase, partial [Gammaproteobacteria bacterium]|nr:bifunctional DNA primase/polymerase [Gammaproteobacteria bacterium]
MVETLALRTGVTTDTAVIDVDPKHGGHLTLANLEAEYGRVPDTVESITGSGGCHLFYAYPGGDLQSGVHV